MPDDARRVDDLPYAHQLAPAAGPPEHGREHDLLHFADTTLDDLAAANAYFVECAFTGTTFEGGSLRRSRLRDVWFGDVRLVGTDIAESSWTDVAFEGAVFAGVAAFGGQWRQVTFRRCKLTGLNLRATELIDVAFEECVLDDVDFGEASMRRVGFRGSRLREVTFGKARLDAVDLRGASLESLQGCESLGGAIVDPAQLVDLAPMLAAALGITVDDG